MGLLARPSRETVFSLIFAHLQTAEGFTTFSRRMQDYSEIPPGLMPICILWEQPEQTEWDGRGLGKDYWHALVAVFFQNTSRPQQNDPTTAIPGSTIVNPLIDAVRAALGPDDGQNNLTLGGLVNWVRVEGTTVVETGDTDASGFGGAIIPLRISVP